MAAGDDCPLEELSLATDLQAEVQQHGGRLLANFLLVCRPDLRKRLGDTKLLRFVRRFPKLFEVTEAPGGGHFVHSVDVSCGQGAEAEAGAGAGGSGRPGHILARTQAVLEAPFGSTLPPKGADRCSVRSERATHALRQLEREILRRLAAGGGGAGTNEYAAGEDAKARDVTWLLRNGKIRRKIGAAMRYHPIKELLVADETEGAPVEASVEEEEEEAAKGVANGGGAEPIARSRCPVSGHARTYAGFILQFFRDRPARFLVSTSTSAEEVQFGSRLECNYSPNSGCPCMLQVELVPGSNSAEVDPEIEELLELVAKRCYLMAKATGSTRVPLARVGRDKEVHAALAGRSLLQLLEADSDQRAARGLQPRFGWDTHSSAFTLGVCEWWLAEMNLLTSSTSPHHGQDEELPTARPNRRMRAPDMQVTILAERPGIVAILKVPGVTTEALLETLEEQLRRRPGQEGLRVISVSRLDRDTSGVLVAATSPEAADHLTHQFKHHEVFKEYIALTTGQLAPASGEVNARLYISGFSEKYRAYVSPKGKEACTRYQVMAYFTGGEGNSGKSIENDAGSLPRQARHWLEGDELATQMLHYLNRRPAHRQSLPTEVAAAPTAPTYSLVACYPITGRTHQIRAHLQWRGHPLVADANYSPRGQVKQQFQWCPRLFLHCRRTRLKDCSGEELAVEAPLLPDLAQALTLLHEADSGTSAALAADMSEAALELLLPSSPAPTTRAPSLAGAAAGAAAGGDRTSASTFAEPSTSGPLHWRDVL